MSPKLGIMLIVALAVSSCRPILDVQGHRGCRGLMPENTVPAFMHALDLGVTTLELDLAISQDEQVVVSHEPYFNYLISLNPSGEPISREDQRNHNLYRMAYEDIKQWDVGMKPVDRFPDQKRIPAYKPLLSEVVSVAEQHATKLGRPLPYYNIEIKSSPQGDGIFHPEVEHFAALVVREIQRLGVLDRTFIQSFDPRSLEAVKRLQSDIALVLLIENEDSVQENLDRLTFTPSVYSPYFKLINQELVRSLQDQGIAVIPWTVNEPSDLENVIRMGVDGIITDYPDRLLQKVRAKR